jgi:hypothetical protein
MHVALFLGSSIRQSGRLLTARFEVQVLAEELMENKKRPAGIGRSHIFIVMTIILCLHFR